MTRPAFVLSALSLTVAAVYLFVNAPPALPEAGAEPGRTIPIERVLATVAAENDIVRALYTHEIVTEGQAAGLRFEEDWREPGIDAGPLPALFLREAAAYLERSPIPLGLFLGSDFPISPSNRFLGRQDEVFKVIKRSRRPEYFYAEDTGHYTAMFPDIAGVQGCVTCHNEHKDSPKTDWVLDDVMGATTWTYDKAAVTQDEYLRIIDAVRQSFRGAYSKYLDKVATFERQPEIGDRWPADGFHLPSADVFMSEFARRASATTVDLLLAGSEQPTLDPDR